MDGGSDSKMSEAAEQKLSTHLHYREIEEIGERPLFQERRCILYIVEQTPMKRTQLYLDEEMARKLDSLSRQKGTTISELVRTSLRERYMAGRDLDKVSIARELSGIWRKSKDLKEIDKAVRNLRRGSRLKGFHLV